MVRRSSYGPLAARLYGLLIDPMVRSLRSRIVRLCQEHGVKDVLDIACATGVQCRLLASAGMTPTGLDLADSMIAAAQRKGPGSTGYVCGSALELPFENGSFDACLLSLALHEHPEDDRQIMVREAVRVLRSDGILVVADYTPPRRAWSHPPWLVIRCIEKAAGADHHAGFADYVRRGGLDGLLARSGLSPTQSSRSHFGSIGIAVARPESRS